MTTNTTPTVAVAVLSGIDVSHYQGAIDWHAVARMGIAFAYAKATDGLYPPDARFADNWTGMQDAAITRGAYHFFRPAASAEAQADRFLSMVTGFQAGDLPPMLDLEEARSGANRPDEWTSIPFNERLPLALAWLEQIEQTLGVRPIVFTRQGWVEANLGAAGNLVNYPLWIAHYTAAAQAAVPDGWSRWTFWQYSKSGRVAGINGPVDLDRFNGSRDDLATLASSAVSSPPQAG